MPDRVSWLIPVKNGMPFIVKTLESIANQTVQSLEVIVLDNGSSDGTLEELGRWIPGRLPGKIIIEPNISLGKARAILVEEANSEFCALIDADDVALEHRLEKQIEFLKLHTNVAAVGCGMYIINERGLRIDNRFPLPSSHFNIICAMLTYNCMPQPGILFRKSAVVNVGNYSEIRFAEDFDLWLRLSIKYDLANIEEPLIEYRIREGSETQIAMQNGAIEKLTSEVASKYALEIWGIDPVDYLAMRSQSHQKVGLMTARIIRHFVKCNYGIVDIIGSRQLWRTFRSFTPSNRIFLRAFFRVASLNPFCIFKYIQCRIF